MYGCENWTINKAECRRIDASELWCVEEDSWKSLELQGDQRSQPKGNQSWICIRRTDAETEALILGPPDVKNWLIRKDPNAGKDWRQMEQGLGEDGMVGWHLWLTGHEFEQTLGYGEGQGSLACYSPWGWQTVGHDWATKQHVVGEGLVEILQPWDILLSIVSD